jgi:hypothetical protein
MFTTVLKEVSSYLDKRFLTTVFAPSLAFWSLLLGLYAMTQGVPQIVDHWEQQTFVVQTFLLALFIGWVLFFAYVLTSFLTALTKLYEGYWEHIPVLRRLSESRRRQHRAELGFLKTELERTRNQYDALRLQLEQHPPADPNKFDALKQRMKAVEAERTARYEEIYYRFPPLALAEAIMPTRIGNIFKNVELYPLVRYNMDAVLLWPRLYQILPTAAATALADAKSAMDFMLVICSLSFGHAIIGSLIVLAGRLSPFLFLTVFWGSLLVGWLAYRGIVEATLSYGQIIKSSFDLYRGELLKELGLKTPASLTEERETWRNINLQLFRGFPERIDALHYASPATSQESKS